MKVVIGIITHKSKEYCIDFLGEFLEKQDKKLVEIMLVDNSNGLKFCYGRLRKLANHLRHAGFAVHQMRGTWTEDVGERIVENRNFLKNKFLETDSKYLLMLDADVIPPKNAIKELLKRKVDVINAVCPISKEVNGKYVVTSNVYHPDGDLKCKDLKKKWKFVKIKDLPTSIAEVIGIGLGCCLVKREVMEKIKFRAKAGKKGWMVCEDLMFCADLHKLGYRVFADCGIRCQHIVKGRAKDDK